MPVPSSISDLSTTAGSNSPAGSDTVTDAAGPDDYLRAHAAIIKTHNDATAIHGATGAVVGTTNTQTLTNKTLTSPILNGTVTLTAPAINGIVTTTGLTLPAATVGALNGTTIPTSKTLLTTDANITSGTWTPTVTENSANIADPTGVEGQYMRVGNVVTGSVVLGCSCSAAGSTVSLVFTLPVASDFAAEGNLAGAGSFRTTSSTGAGRIFADATNNVGMFSWVPAHTLTHTVTLGFTYIIL